LLRKHVLADPIEDAPELVNRFLLLSDPMRTQGKSGLWGEPAGWTATLFPIGRGQRVHGGAVGKAMDFF
jgi:hypothetical protein